jgi:hypothetical protein
MHSGSRSEPQIACLTHRSRLAIVGGQPLLEGTRAKIAEWRMGSLLCVIAALAWGLVVIPASLLTDLSAMVIGHGRRRVRHASPPTRARPAIISDCVAGSGIGGGYDSSMRSM